MHFCNKLLKKDQGKGKTLYDCILCIHQMHMVIELANTALRAILYSLSKLFNPSLKANMRIVGATNHLCFIPGQATEV